MGTEQIYRSSINVLFAAVKHNNKEIIEHILTLPQAKQLEVDDDYYGRSILFWAVSSADVSLVRFFVNRHGLDKLYIATTDGVYPIHVAASNGATAVVTYLVEECGVSVDLEEKHEGWNDRNNTSLMKAAGRNQLQTVKELIRLGANKTPFNMRGSHPIHFAAGQGHTAMITYLVEECGISVDLEEKNEEGRTPLMIAAYQNELNTVKELIRLGANKTRFNNQGLHPIHFAAKGIRCTAIVTYIVEECGISVNLETNNKKADTPLRLAAWKIQFDTMLELIRLGANKAIINNTMFNGDGEHPIHVAAGDGHTAMITYLVEECGISVNLKTNNKEACTPLRAAAKYVKLQTMQELIRLGADKGCLNYFDRDGYHAIHAAVVDDDRAMITYLVKECGISVDQPMNDLIGDTPLCFAARFGLLETMKTLIRLGAKFVCNKEGKFPIDLAMTDDCIAALYDPNVALQKKNLSSTDIFSIAAGRRDRNLMKRFNTRTSQEQTEQYITQNNSLWRDITEYQKSLMDKHHLIYLDLLEVLIWFDPMTARLASVCNDFSFKSRGLDDTVLTNHILSYLITANQAILKPKQIIALMQPDHYQRKFNEISSRNKIAEDIAHLYSYFGIFRRLDKVLTERNGVKHNEDDEIYRNDGIAVFWHY